MKRHPEPSDASPSRSGWIYSTSAKLVSDASSISEDELLDDFVREAAEEATLEEKRWVFATTSLFHFNEYLIDTNGQE